MEYEREKAFFVAMWALLVERTPEIATPAAGLASPVDNLATLESKSPSLARRGLRQAVSDLLEVSRDWTSAEVAAADLKLQTQHAPQLSEMRRKVWKLVPKILARRRVRNDEEYYLLKSQVDDLASELGSAERELAGLLLHQYEAARAGSNSA